MRVLMLISDFRVGGAETAAVELIRALRGRGEHEFIVAPVRDQGPMADAYVQAGALLEPPLAHAWLDPLAPLRLARAVRRHGAGAMVYLDALRNGMFYSLPASPLHHPLPRILWCHSLPCDQSGRYMPRLRAFSGLGMVNGVVCVSRFQRDELVHLGVNRRITFVVYNGVDTQRFTPWNPPASAQDLPLPAGRKVIVQVANLMPIKDFDTLLRAAQRLAQRRDDFHLVLAGRNTDSPWMAEAIGKLGLTGRVTALGHRKDIPEILARADIFVLSTWNDIFSIATLEAMASGKPVVVSDIPAFAEMIAAERDGLKAPPGDADALAAAMGRLLDDEGLRRRLAANGRATAERFSLDEMARKFNRLLKSLERSVHLLEGRDL